MQEGIDDVWIGGAAEANRWMVAIYGVKGSMKSSATCIAPVASRCRTDTCTTRSTRQSRFLTQAGKLAAYQVTDIGGDGDGDGADGVNALITCDGGNFPATGNACYYPEANLNAMAWSIAATTIPWPATTTMLAPDLISCDGVATDSVHNILG